MQNRTHARRRVARLAGFVSLALGLCLSLASCRGFLDVQQLEGSPANAPSNRVVMGIASFYPTAVRIHAGQSVIFDDPKGSGGVHFICVGTDLKCEPKPGTPPQLVGRAANGRYFENGSPAESIQFNTPGDYQVICTIHPGMMMHVIVS